MSNDSKILNKNDMYEKFMKYSDFMFYNMTIEDVKSKLKADLTIDENNIDGALMNVNIKASKWLDRYISFSRLTNLAEDEMNRIYKRKYHHFRFEDSDGKKIDRNDVKHYVNDDDEFIAIKQTYDNLKHILKFLENAHKKVSEMTFVIESIINWKKYLAGKQ